jgi:hypothetical protein
MKKSSRSCEEICMDSDVVEKFGFAGHEVYRETYDGVHLRIAGKDDNFTEEQARYYAAKAASAAAEAAVRAAQEAVNAVLDEAVAAWEAAEMGETVVKAEAGEARA